MTSTPPLTSLLVALASDSGAGEAVHDPDRDRVLDAARSALLDFGIRRTSMGEIARRAGVSPASLYRWYGTKDDVVVAVFVRESKRFAAAVEASIDPAAAPEDQLAEAAVQVAERLRTQPLVQRLIETEPESVLPQLTRDGGPLIEAGVVFLSPHIRRLVDPERMGGLESDTVAELLIRVVHSLLLTPSTSLPLDDHADLRSLCRDAVRWLAGTTHPHSEGSPS